jgi:hypothetical protein
MPDQAIKRAIGQIPGLMREEQTLRRDVSA